MKRDKVAFVTGATGFIGRSLVRHLLDRGYRVRIFVRKPPPEGFADRSVQIAYGDINDRDALIKATRETDVVFHLAAKLHMNNPGPELQSDYNRINVEGTRVMVEAAQINGVQRLVYFSTISVYGPGQDGIVFDESSPLRPQNLYAETKCRGEEIVLSAAGDNKNNFLGVVLRPAAVYGPRMKGNYAKLARALRKGWFLPLGSGLNRRTLVYNEDLVFAARLVAEHPRAAGQVYNVTDGQVHCFNEILTAICHALGKRPPRYRLPEKPLRLMIDILEKGCALANNDLPSSCASVKKLVEDVAVSGEKIQRELGFTPQFDLSTGWKASVDYLFNGCKTRADM